MSIVSTIKDTGRKITNSVVDTTENVMVSPKSIPELTKRIVEHIAHQEYNAIATILVDEIRKYLKRMNLDNPLLISKLEEFEITIHSIADDFEEGEYDAGIATLKDLESSIMGQIDKGGEALKTGWNILNVAFENVTGSHGKNKDVTHKNRDNRELQSKLEEHFNKLTAPNEEGNTRSNASGKSEKHSDNEGKRK